MHAIRAMLLCALAIAFAPAARAAGGCDGMTPKEYETWRDYQAAIKDPVVLKMKEAKRKPAIAKNFKISLKELEAALKKGDAQGADLPKKCEESSKEGVAGTPLTERVLSLSVDPSTSEHVVTYVSWRARKPAELEEEASLLAFRLARASPLSKTIAMWAEDDQGKKVFEAKILSERALNFKEDRISEFADSRYIRLFEDVKNSYAAEASGGN